MIAQPFFPSLRSAKGAAAALILGAILCASASLAQGSLPEQPLADSSLDRAHIEQVLGSLGRGHLIEQAAISPDGQRLAWIEHTKDGLEIRIEPLDDLIHGLPRSIEGFWSLLKRSIKGTHVHVSAKHLSKYLGEFEFRYNLRHSPQVMFDRLVAGF